MTIRDRIKELRRVRARDLRPSPRNWRTHPKAQQDALKGILAEVGYADALLARELPDGSLELVDGHLRAETTPDQLVPVLVLDVNEAEADKLLAVLDPLASLATGDPESVSVKGDALAELLEDLAKEHGLDQGGEVAEVEVPEPLPTPVTRPGDLWLLPSADPKVVHRLFCADATDPAVVARLLAGAKAALCATDPPYLVDYTGERPDHDGGNLGGKDWSKVYREVDIIDAEGFFRSVFKNILLACTANAAIYCWHAHKRQGVIAKVWEELGILNHQQVIWVKPTPVFGRVFWHFRHEPCMMGWRQGHKPRHDGDHSLSSVWEVDWEGKSRVVGNEHPTQKPLELFARPIRRHTKKGDVVLEPFTGSGSQLVAAEQLGRNCYGLELEPVFVDVAIRRWEGLTGIEAVLESVTSAPKTFSQVAQERGVVLPGAAPARAAAGLIEVTRPAALCPASSTPAQKAKRNPNPKRPPRPHSKEVSHG